MNKDYLYLGIMTITMIILLTLMVYTHEQTHQTIYKYAGIESEITLSLNGGLTTPLPDQNKTMPQWALIGQVNTEAFGYQLQTTTISIIITIIMSSIYIGWKIENTTN